MFPVTALSSPRYLAAVLFSILQLLYYVCTFVCCTFVCHFVVCLSVILLYVCLSFCCMFVCHFVVCLSVILLYVCPALSFSILTTPLCPVGSRLSNLVCCPV